MAGYLEEMVDKVVRKIRAIPNNLMPNVLIDYGLEKGLSAFITKINLIVDIDLNISLKKN